MAYFTLQTGTGAEPLVSAWIGVSQQRAAALGAVGQAIPPRINIRALIDTGASNTSIDLSIIQQLGLKPTGVISVHTASSGNSPHQTQQYDVSILIPGVAATDLPLHVPTVAVNAVSLVGSQPFAALIGRDILQSCVLIYNARMGFFTLAF